MLRGEEGLNPGLFSPGTGPLFLFPAAVPVFPHSLSGHTGDTQGLTQGKQKAQTGQGHKDGTYAEHSGAGRPHAGRRTGQKHYGESRGEKVQGREGGETGDLTAGVFLFIPPLRTAQTWAAMQKRSMITRAGIIQITPISRRDQSRYRALKTDSSPRATERRTAKPK